MASADDGYAESEEIIPEIAKQYAVPWERWKALCRRGKLEEIQRLAAHGAEMFAPKMPIFIASAETRVASTRDRGDAPRGANAEAQLHSASARIAVPMAT